MNFQPQIRFQKHSQVGTELKQKAYFALKIFYNCLQTPLFNTALNLYATCMILILSGNTYGWELSYGHQSMNK